MSQVALNVWCWDKEESFISIHQLLKGVELITYPLVKSPIRRNSQSKHCDEFQPLYNTEDIFWLS